MNTKKVYIAGKVTGEPYEDCKAKFNRRAEILRKQGYEVINPVEIVSRTASWETAMKICIKALVNCDAYYMLPGWRDSRGAKIEYKLAQVLGLQNLNGKL
jgi:predicted secreted Zn-dependent protease